MLNQECIINFMTMQKTFLAVKPQAMERGDAVEIVKVLAQKLEGAKCLGMKVYTPTKELAEKHYEALSDKPFFPELIESFTTGPILGMIWEGEGVVAKAREVMGATNPADAAEGTIRKLFAKSIGDNAIHGSDTEPGSAEREVEIHFAGADFAVIADPVAEAESLAKTAA